MYHLSGITRKLQAGIWFANVISCIWERPGGVAGGEGGSEGKGLGVLSQSGPTYGARPGGNMVAS